jgi:hypothetical protein
MRPPIALVKSRLNYGRLDRRRVEEFRSLRPFGPLKEASLGRAEIAGKARALSHFAIPSLGPSLKSPDAEEEP